MSLPYDLDSGIVWTSEVLNEYLINPKKMIPGKTIWPLFDLGMTFNFHGPIFMKFSGTKMVFAGLKKKGDRKNLIAFLETCK